MKKCPHCNEEIQDIAKKCRFCGEWIESSNATVINDAFISAPERQTFISFTQGLFSGRLDRRNFTKGFFLFIFLLFVPPIIAPLLYTTNSEVESFYTFTTFVWTLPLLILLVAIHVRRLHDTNRKGTKLFLFVFTMIIPFLLIWNLTTIFQKGDNNSNNYDEKPDDKRKFWSAVLNLKKA